MVALTGVLVSVGGGALLATGQQDAAVGQLDDQALFYLRSRGIPLDQARALLTRAFAEEVVQRVSVQAWQQRIEFLLSLKLGGEARA
jgi:Fe-S cluster assembly protein SufD